MRDHSNYYDFIRIIVILKNVWRRKAHENRESGCGVRRQQPGPDGSEAGGGEGGGAAGEAAGPLLLRKKADDRGQAKGPEGGAKEGEGGGSQWLNLLLG